VLSVVIVNYNTRDLLRDCLRSLQAVTIPLEVIVVDNASSDGSAVMVADEFPDVTLLAQSENTWFCGGNNIGVVASSGELVLLLNPDTVVQPNALETLVAFMDENPDYAGCTARMHYPDGSVQRTCSRIPTYSYLLLSHTFIGAIFRRWRDRLTRHHWYDDEGFTRNQSRDVAVIPGSCMLMRRDCYPLDDDLLLYFPEDDIAQRHADKRFRFVAEAHITHREKSATRSWLASRVYFRDLLFYTRKHHGIAGVALMWTLTRPTWIGMRIASTLRGLWHGR
jgi:GT2 family glycosyltransferase